jgi:3-oxoacyl-[acyl-carrier protein] reductase
MNNKRERELVGKVALVTGGSRGIGAAIAKRLAADGASVAVTYSKSADAAASVVKAIERAGGKAIAIQADAADVEAVKGAVEKTVATFGRLDVLVNNAGTAIPKPFEAATLEEMDRVIDINIRGVYVTTQRCCHEGGGRIIRRFGQSAGAVSCALGGHEGCRQDAPSARPEIGSRGTCQQRSRVRSTRWNPASAIGTAESATALTATDTSVQAAMVAFVAGPVLIHDRGESYRGWRNECLTASRIDSLTSKNERFKCHSQKFMCSKVVTMSVVSVTCLWRSRTRWSAS